jgi:hypothetical protein
MFQPPANSLADPAAVVTAPHARFTVLTPRLLRLEHSAADQFEDRASQVFWRRQQPAPAFTLQRSDAEIEITTEFLCLRYRHSPRGFTPQTLSIELRQFHRTVWHYGDRNRRNLHGTYRTLDGISGAAGLEPGLMSRAGWALGNWWSRYWAYTQDELTHLMEAFEAHAIPLSVCVIDMDWHVTNTGNASSGWTGYTWNTDLFPDPPAFLAWLHARGLKTALNLHPAEGAHPHEAAYPAMAQWMQAEPGAPVPFDCADPQFMRGYFEILHHPLEAQGVDFWWVDWQQGTQTNVHGLDPLWWLNHLHFYDLARDGRKRPFVFSRWGGLGNHRYPIGFSGDTLVTWESLAFQPYFTATAANVGYGWWSHDIGGHMGGVEDGELYTR